ncbi:lipocalin family protein [Cetobacterium somerae]|uniref:lipocalin family protein n=1 Tax=Cetobacterium sp. NK01 TaxID=2993530 RepID=UPI0021169E27|nr:lipocalin family protein [Cetobacterium sp. NK01]MCQ8211144.1 lipocalin family protein [Cetobacterium sp. NK01]
MMLKKILVLLFSTLFISCSNSPKIEENSKFSIEKYLGRWYEIKRFDHSFEKGLKEVTANYTLERNGKISVVNRGIDSKNKESIFHATAKQTDVPNFLKVYPNSFPIIGAQYNIAWISDNYNYAIVTSSSFKYLWFLSREKTIPLNIYNEMIQKAKALGFNTENLIDGQ